MFSAFRSLSLGLCLFALARAAEPGWTLEEIENPHIKGSPICDDVQQYAGYFKLSTGDKNYFYWFFESRSKPATDPVLLWMTGGPGCSSEVALFGENGPCQVNKLGTSTTKNPYSWNSNANIIYIDQPTGTGFSYGKGLDHNETQVSRDMYDFLQKFFKGHTQYASLPFFVFGESYAGHYVPAVTHLVYKNNQNLPAGAIKINLKGTAIGNGLVDPLTQFKYYPPMIVSDNDHKPVANNATKAIMEAALPACIAAIKLCDSQPETCVLAIDTCNLSQLMPYQLTGMNPYDMRVTCAKPPLCYDFSNVGTYLERPEVQQALGVTGKKWSDCNREVALMFELSGDWMQSFQTSLPDQLAGGIEVLVYAGDQDYICNWLGNQAWSLGMVWPHQQEFNNAPVQDWTVGGKAAGTIRSSNGFTFLRVLDAGHMVPRDQPAHALAMVNAFIAGSLAKTAKEVSLAAY